MEAAKSMQLHHETEVIPEDAMLIYRAYKSVKPVCNKYLAKKWDDATRDRHVERVKTMAPRIDNAPPTKYKHLEMPSRRLRMEEGEFQNEFEMIPDRFFRYLERLNRIDRENNLLLQKMIRIIKHTPPWYNDSVEQRIIDNRKKSVEDRRRQEQERIAAENKVGSYRIFIRISLTVCM